MSSPAATPLPKSVKTWAGAGFVLAGIYLLAAMLNLLPEAGPRRLVALAGLVVCLPLGLGSFFALKQ